MTRPGPARRARKPAGREATYSRRVAFSIIVRVRYAECDMQGHVFNAHYLTWFDMAHTALLTTALAQPYSAIVAGGVDIVVAESGVRYLAPARFEDELSVGVQLQEPTRTSLTSSFTIRRGEKVIATGFLRHVCVNPETMQKMAWPDEIRAALAPYVASDSSASPAQAAAGESEPSSV